MNSTLKWGLWVLKWGRWDLNPYPSGDVSRNIFPFFNLLVWELGFALKFVSVI
jgi:hypothetical protein